MASLKKNKSSKAGCVASTATDNSAVNLKPEKSAPSDTRSSLLGVAIPSAPSVDAESSAPTETSSDAFIHSELTAKVRADMRSQSRIIEENIRAHQLKLHFQRDETNLVAAENVESASLREMESKEREVTLWQLSKDLKDRSHRKELKVVLNEACSMLKDVQLELSHKYEAQEKLAQVRLVLQQKRKCFQELSRGGEDRETLERLELTESHAREARNLESWCELDMMHLSATQLENQRTRDRLNAQQVKEKQQKEAEQHRELQILKSKYSMSHFDAELVFAEEYERLVAEESISTNALFRRHKAQKKALKNKLLMSRELVRQRGHATMKELRLAHVSEQQEKKAANLKTQKLAARNVRAEQFKEEQDMRRKEFLEEEDMSQLGTGSYGSSSHKNASSKNSHSDGGNNKLNNYMDSMTNVSKDGMDGLVNTEEMDVQIETASNDLNEKLAEHQRGSEKAIQDLLEKQKCEKEEREKFAEKTCQELVTQWEQQSSKIKHEHEQDLVAMRKYHASGKAEMQTGHDRETEALEHSIKLERRVRKQDVDEKVVSSQAKSEFLSFVCHELRNPLSGVLAIVDLLLSTTNMTKEVKSQVSLIKQEANTMCSIVNDVLDFAKIEANMLVLDPVDFNLSMLVSKCLKDYQDKVKSKGLSLQYDFGKAVPQMVCADPVRLKQVLGNLLSNAVKFTSKGVIKVSVHLESTLDQGNQLIAFVVADTGVGIQSQDLPHIFSAFSQSNPSSTRTLGGSGLGLGISKALVERLGGTITVTSQKDMGSTFRFTILAQNTAGGNDTPAPVAESEFTEDASEAGKPTDDSSALSECESEVIPALQQAFPKDLTVLVVEDSVTLLRLWAKLVRNLGCEVDTAPNGQEALDKCAVNSYNIVLMDISMPKLSGDKAVQKLRESGWKGIVIALTANSSNSDCASYIELGFDSVITKPFQMETLREAILEQISKREMKTTS